AFFNHISPLAHGRVIARMGTSVRLRSSFMMAL
ncbi:MAG: hypothetical protein ACI90V_004145, partial [Bacillariaceae sp.]